VSDESATTGTRGLRHWLGLERNILVMTAAVLVLGLGEELWQRFVPKYLEVLGGGAFAIAAYGTLKDLLDAVYQYPGGWLADRLGRRSALTLFTLLASAGYLIYLFAPSWPWVLAGTFLVMAWTSLTSPAIFAIIADNLPPARRAIGFGVQSILKRIPPLVATPLGGWLIALLGLVAGVRVGLLVTLALAALGIVIVRRYYKESAPAEHDPIPAVALWRGMDPRLKRLLVADCLARWAEGIPKVFVILYVLDVRQLSALDFGWLVGIQRLTSILVYLPLAKLSDRMNRKPFVMLTFAFFALFPLVLVQASEFAGMALAFAVAGLWEVGEPARKALIMDLASPTARGRAVGLYYLVRGLVVFPASLVGGWLWLRSYEWPFYAAALVGAGGFLVYTLWGPGDQPATPAAREE
jgi:MFS family permease